MARKPITAAQEIWHAGLTIALAGSPGMGLGLALWAYYHEVWIGPSSVVLGFLPVFSILLPWLNTEVQWRKREDAARRVVARIVKH